MSSCKHIQKLPMMPSPLEMVEIRNSIKKKKSPSINDGDNGGHDELGFFAIHFEDEPVIEWNLKRTDSRRFKFSDLCERADHEMQRLEVGWLIGNIYSLNKMHDLERIGVPAGEAGLNEYARISNWYEKKEKIWYEWAIAKA